MNQFHQYVAYFALIFGSLSVVGVCLYGTVRCFRTGKYLAGSVISTVIPCWFAANMLLTIVMYAIATPNAAVPTHPAEYAVGPVYLAVAGFVCYAVLRYVRKYARSKKEPLPAVQYRSSTSYDEAVLIRVQSGIQSFLEWIALSKTKIVGVIFVALGAVGISSFFLPSGVLLVVIGVSLIMDVRLWRR